MANLEIALKYAALGWQLFPCRWGVREDAPPGTKPSHIPYTKWGRDPVNGISSDPEVIKWWAQKYPECYFCVALAPSGQIVLDSDRKNNKDGEVSLLNLQRQYGFKLPKTLLVLTPSNGFHRYYLDRGYGRSGKLARGVDMPYMVPLPGSIVPGKGEYKIIEDNKIAVIPAIFERLVSTSQTQRAENTDTPIVPWDEEENIERAISYLLYEAKPAIQGDGGNNTTFRVACKVGDFAVSEQKCVELMLEYYDPRCEPSWGDEITNPIKSAYSYRKTRPGSATAQADFQLEILKPSQPPLQSGAPIIPNNNDIIIYDACSLVNRAISIQWLIKKYIDHNTIGVMYGDPGSLKSFIALDMGLRLAYGMPWADMRPIKTPGLVFYLAGEGHQGLMKRVKAWYMHNGIPLETAIPFCITNTVVSLDKMENVNRLIATLQRYAGWANMPVNLIVLDTLSTIMGDGEENSNTDMNKFLGLVKVLKWHLNCTVLIVHHTGHKEKGRTRGASALIGGVDLIFPVATDPTNKLITCVKSATKVKDGEPQKDTWFEGSQILLGHDEDGDEITSLALTHVPGYQPADVTNAAQDFKGAIPIVKSEEQRKILDYLALSGPINKDLFLADMQRNTEIVGKVFHKGNFSRSLKALIERGIASVDINNHLHLLVQGGY